MSDFASEFWPYYVAVTTLLSILGCAALLKMNSTRRVTAAEAESAGHVWDGDLTENHHPLPRWWVWLFYFTIVLSLVYLVLYPGLGNFGGAYQWTSTGQYDAEMKAADAQFGPIYAKYGGQDIPGIAADPEARAIGQKLFLNHCAQCHASDARGSRGFPNLADKDWLWGGDPESIRASITNGRNGVMPAFGPILGYEGVRDVAHYVMSLAKSTHDSIRAARGREKFSANCVVCHGADARGNRQLGAPNLTDNIWLHGSGEARISETIAKGRNNVMPAHKEFLSEAKLQILAAFVYGLQGTAESAEPPESNRLK